MELGLRTCDGRRSRAIVGSGVAFAKVIGLDVGGDAAEEFPVDFVEVVGE